MGTLRTLYDNACIWRAVNACLTPGGVTRRLSAAKVLIAGRGGLVAEVHCSHADDSMTCFTCWASVRSNQTAHQMLQMLPLPVCRLRLFLSLCFGTPMWGILLQVAKNVVLAGAGVVSLIDDTPVSQMNAPTFLVAHDTDQSSRCSCTPSSLLDHGKNTLQVACEVLMLQSCCFGVEAAEQGRPSSRHSRSRNRYTASDTCSARSVATASAATLQEMNPHVRVQALPGSCPPPPPPRRPPSPAMIVHPSPLRWMWPMWSTWSCCLSALLSLAWMMSGHKEHTRLRHMSRICDTQSA